MKGLLTRIRLVGRTNGIPLALLLLSGSAARADYVKATLDNTLPSVTVNLTVNKHEMDKVPAGALHWTKDGGNAALPAHFTTFCTELTQYVGVGQSVNYQIANVKDVPYDSSHPGTQMGDAKAALVRELWGTYRNQAVDATSEAAFQIDIWEIVYDTGRNLSSGNFLINYDDPKNPPDYVTLGQKWLDSLADPNHHLANGLVGLSNGDFQDQLTTVPVPPSAVLLSIGGLGFLASAWRRFRLTARTLLARP